jgi:hypothetical protein
MMKIKRNPFKYVGVEIAYNVNSLFATFHFWRMKRRALRAWKMTGVQHHIVPAGADKCIIVNNRWRKAYNKKAQRKIDINQLLNMAYFSTPVGKRVITK